MAGSVCSIHLLVGRQAGSVCSIHMLVGRQIGRHVMCLQPPTHLREAGTQIAAGHEGLKVARPKHAALAGQPLLVEGQGLVIVPCRHGVGVEA